MNFKHSQIAVFGAGNMFEIGGLQRSYAMLTGHLAETGHDVFFYAYNTGFEPGRTFAFPMDERVAIRLLKTLPSAKNDRDIRAQLRRDKPDVILIVNSTWRLASLLAAVRPLRIPTVVSIRGNTDFCLRYFWPCKRLLDLCYMFADAGHVLMPSYMEPFSPAAREKITVIPSQIQPATQRAEPDRPDGNGRYSILYSGRMAFEKRVGLLINAFALCAGDFPDWDLQLYGTGPELEDLKTMVEQQGLENRIFFGTASNTDEMYEVYPKAHIKVLPSEAEACPMALREAMAHALPVIGFAECSGTNEIVTPGKDGLLAGNGDRVKELKIALETLMRDPGLRRTMGDRAEETAAAYHPDAIHKAWETLLLDTAARKRNGPRERISRFLRRPGEYLKGFWQFKLQAGTRDYRWCILLNEGPARLRNILGKHFREYLTLYDRPLFDPRFYLQTNPDVNASGKDPLLHYIEKGWKEGRDPSPFFNNNAYIDRAMNGVASSSPLYHYYTRGFGQGALPEPADSDYLSTGPTWLHTGAARRAFGE